MFWKLPNATETPLDKQHGGIKISSPSRLHSLLSPQTSILADPHFEREQI